MQIYPSRTQFAGDPAAASLMERLEAKNLELGLASAVLYHNFPLYRDDEGGVIVANAVLLSPRHGVIAFALSNSSPEAIPNDLDRCRAIVEQVPPYVHSRLIRNRQLRKSATQLAFEITPVVYAPFAGPQAQNVAADLTVLESESNLEDLFDRLRTDAMPAVMFQELLSSIDGAKGLIRPKKRTLPPDDSSSKGKQAELIEAAITNFDLQQKQGIMGLIRGPQRLRGLAGSGKTVVLSMKAALTHLQFPDAKIVYTFCTKSLYQHVKRLITRFYRQFDDRDPDWEKRVHVLHGWGSSSTPGVYSEACENHGVTPLSFSEAGSGDKFDFVCRELLKSSKIRPTYDYVFVDEGQDFPISFVRLCHQLAKEGRFVLAYDDLQTLFQASTPNTAEIFGTNEDGSPKGEFEEDLVLHKCYRNPREVLVCAHALGFGIYGKRIVQMLENREHWEDIGYRVAEGDFRQGSVVRIERPEENSLKIISELSGFDEIVKVQAFPSMNDEISHVAKSVVADIGEGLHPEDILVVSVDDRYAKAYLSRVERALQGLDVKCNNLHSDSFGIRDFSKDGRVTLSTVHKAKGNEAFMVYVVGVDAVMAYPDVKRRNMLFTAMTRAKGWVRVSGVGGVAERCVVEVTQAKANYPYLVFKYPSQAELKVMKRDLAETADRKLKGKRLLEQLRQDFTDEEIELLLKEKKAARKAVLSEGTATIGGWNVIGDGRFRTYLNRIEAVLGRIGLLESRVRFPNKALGASFFRGKSYREVWETCVNEFIHDFVLADQSILLFGKGGNDEHDGELRFAYYECPVRVVSYEEFCATEVGVSRGDPEYESAIEEWGDSLRREYEQYVLSSEAKSIVTPIRYDYSAAQYRSGRHPASHIHFGFENPIRVATRRILNPVSFLLLIIRQRYPDHWQEFLQADSRRLLCRNVREVIDDVHDKYWQPLDQFEMWLN